MIKFREVIVVKELKRSDGWSWRFACSDVSFWVGTISDLVFFVFSLLNVLFFCYFFVFPDLTSTIWPGHLLDCCLIAYLVLWPFFSPIWSGKKLWTQSEAAIDWTSALKHFKSIHNASFRLIYVDFVCNPFLQICEALLRSSCRTENCGSHSPTPRVLDSKKW